MGTGTTKQKRVTNMTEDFQDLDELLNSEEFKAELANVNMPDEDNEEIEEINDRYSIKHEMALEDVFSFFG